MNSDSNSDSIASASTAGAAAGPASGIAAEPTARTARAEPAHEPSQGGRPGAAGAAPHATLEPGAPLAALAEAVGLPAWTASPATIVALAAVVVALLLAARLVRLRRAQRAERGASGLLERALRDELRAARTESTEAARDLRAEVSSGLHGTSELLVSTVSEMGKVQNVGLEAVAKQLATLTETNESRIERLRRTIDEQLRELQQSNEKKLEAMRQTVDERLQTTLEKRLGESFKLVGDRLEAVQKGLGEMQSLAAGVGDLKRVLTNVKTRGAWGEVQLGSILEQVLTVDQYETNVQTKPGSREYVEFAIKLPGRGDPSRGCVWMPIDSKFPQEDYLRLKEAADAGDPDAVAQASQALGRAVTVAAKDISRKYLSPPATTDFALLFLPTEGLYAEVIRVPGLLEELQQGFRIVVAGPTTLAAILNSLRLGFRTLAIEERASEVWQLLAAVKTEFAKFGDVLAKVKKQLDAASNTIDKTGVRTRAIERKLSGVESLPLDRVRSVLGDAAADESDVDPAAADDDDEAAPPGRGSPRALLAGGEGDAGA